MAKKKKAASKTAAKKAPVKKAARKPVAKPAGKKKPAAKAAAKKTAAKPAAAPAPAQTDGWIKEGSAAPDFTAVAHDGSKVSLGSLKGRPVVLYFYPKDDTPGCTIEACGFRDAHAKFGKHKAVVLGVSPDSPKSHVKFRTKYKLPFTLLADEAHKLAEAFGAWREKSLYGKKYMGVARSTFVIDPAGRIAKAFTAVKPEGHEKEVLEVVAKLK